jgi:hypothetical protein
LAQASPPAQVRPVQQAWPAAPHCWQVLLMQLPPGWQAPSMQQAPPNGPQLYAALCVEHAARHAIRVSARMTTS